MISVNELIETIERNKNRIFVNSNLQLSPVFKSGNNLTNLGMLIPEEYWTTTLGKVIYSYFVDDKGNLSGLLRAKYRKTGVKQRRTDMAEDLAEKKYFLLEKQEKVFKEQFRNEIIHNTLKWEALDKVKSSLEADVASYQINIFNNLLKHLFAEKKYGEFFWWLFLYALFQEDINYFYKRIPKTQYYYICEYLLNFKNLEVPFAKSQLMEISEKNFWDLRRELIRTSKGDLIIAGSSLMDAFDQFAEKKHDIIGSLEDAVSHLNSVSVLLTDPELFDSHYGCQYPIRDISGTIDTFQNVLYDMFESFGVGFHVYFLPMLHIDHAIITEEFMAFRSTKLWTSDRKYKGAFQLFVSDQYNDCCSEYKAHKEYIKAIMKNSTIIYPSDDTDDSCIGESSARGRHMNWRKKLRDENYKYVFFHKLYEKQLYHYVCDTWNAQTSKSGTFIPNSEIKDYNQLFENTKLLNDTSQQKLLPYLKTTRELFSQVIKKHDQGNDSFCRIFPSLDLGFPNNVQRLAGGFATGMLITWNCGIDIVPVDATVNVCTSSVFRLTNFNPENLKDNYQEKLSKIFNKASEKKGYSFSFAIGNHFFMIAQDIVTHDYYLVLHSSANELKNSYMGLYPVEKNWYADKVKCLYGEKNRYIRYLKDNDARHFITMAHHFEHYNVQIHKWLAEQINGKSPLDETHMWIKHHYYMPTDNSIAIGTFAEPIGQEVPLFSAPGKPVYIFEIGRDNWQVSLGDGRKVCLVPHGWGQEIDGIQSIEVDSSRKNLILKINNQDNVYPISSSSRINCKEKRIRDFKDANEFLNKGTNIIKGTINHTLIPVFEYSKNTIS